MANTILVITLVLSFQKILSISIFFFILPIYLASEKKKDDRFSKEAYTVLQKQDKSDLDLLVSQGFDINSIDDNKYNFLMLAIQLNADVIFHYLIEKGADINYINEYSGSVLTLAIQSRNDTIFNILLNQKNLNLHPKPLSQNNNLNYLEEAIIYGTDSMVQSLVSKGFNVNLKNKDNNFPLFYALNEDYFTKAKILLENKANPNLLKDDPNFLYKLYSLYKLKSDWLKLFKEYGLNIDNNEMTLLRIAIDRNDISFLNYLIQNKVPIDPKALGRKFSFLHLAISLKQEDTVKILLDAGYDPKEIYKDGNTPLHLAISSDMPKTVKLLLDKGLSPMHENKGGYTPIDYASKKPEILKLLKKKK